MKGLKTIFVLLVLLILLVAAWQNIPPILEKHITLQLNLHWAKWQTEPIPLYLIMPICFVVGFGLMWVLDLNARMRLRRQVRVLEKELGVLRAQTGDDSSSSLEPFADDSVGEEPEPEEFDESMTHRA